MADEVHSQAKVLGTVGFYMTAAIVMVTVNKWVLTATPIPITFITCQLFVGALLIYVTKVVCRMFGWAPGGMKIGSLDRTTAKGLWQLIVMNGMGLLLGNLCLRHVDASFYQIARGLILPFTVILAYALQANPPSKMAALSCLIVTIGFLVGTSGSAVFTGKGESGVTLIGVIFGISSSLVTAYHSILIKKSLPIVNGSTMDLAYYSNFYSACLLIPIIFLGGEGPELWRMAIGEVKMTETVVGTLVTGMFGFLIGIAGLLSVKVTSPVTHMVSSAVRGVVQTVVSMYFFGDIITSARALSLIIIVGGSCHYVYVKHMESQAASAGYASVPQAAEMDRLEEGKGFVEVARK